MGFLVNIVAADRETLIENYKKSTKPKCGAHSRRTGEPCKNFPMRGRKRCKFHGGKSPIGISHKNFKHGKLCGYLPDRLVHNFKEASNDPNLLELRQELALVDSRVLELVQGLDKKGNAQQFKELQSAFSYLLELRQSGANGELLDEAISRMGASIEAGVQNHDIWEDIGVQIDRRQRLTESERKRLSDTHQMISSERLMALLAGILKIIMDHVQDYKVRQVIRYELLQLLPDQQIAKASRAAPRPVEAFDWVLEGEEPLPENIVDANAYVNAETAE
ncbi:MAG: HGGxSTG domain-containing protein [Candidatus Thorarchaeota archaeon]